MTTRIHCLTGAMLTLAVGLSAIASSAQTYPNRPVKIIVPYSAGGGGDLFPRSIGNRLQEELGQPVIFENRPGASASLGMGMVAQATPDGYTLGATAPGAMVIYPHLATVQYDPIKDFAPIAMIATSPHIVVVNAKLPIKSVAELVAYVKARPGAVNFGSTGVTSLSRISAEVFNRAVGIDALHVPYQSGAPTATALASGEVQYGVPDVTSMLAMMKSEHIRGLAVTTPARSQLAPDIPTLAEVGIKDFTITAWVGMLAPAGTPAPIVARLNAAVNKALSFPEVKERLLNIGADPAGGTAEAFGKVMRDDAALYGKIIREAGIKVQ